MDIKKRKNNEKLDRCLLCGNATYRIIKKNRNAKDIGMCTNCHFVQVIPHVINQKYEAVHFDDWEHDNPYVSQLAAHRVYFKKLITYIRLFMGEPSSIKLLDVGCAIGVLVKVAMEEGIDAEGIDIAQTAISYAQKKFHVPVTQGTCTTWFIKKQYKNHYDVITALEVIEHEENPIQMMKIIHTMLRPGGTVIITTPNFNTLYRILMGKAWVGYEHTEHLWFFTPETILQMLRKAGFSDIHVQKDFYRPYSVSYMFRRLGDYIKSFRFLTNICATMTKRWTMTIPFNPWGDMLITAKK
jgi:2-polyprenyl-3-methyl-5-hydroxy-6-metoxy-1,4-benzoquinol methylase